MMALSQTVVGDWRLDDEPFLASFSLPRAEDRIDPLAALNPLPGENRLRFDAELHRYCHDDVLVPRSVTALVKSYCAEFDAKRAAEGMLSSSTWPERRAEYEVEGVATAESIVAQWTRNGEVQRARGQLLHFQADQLCQGRCIDEPWSPELRQGQAILNTLQLHGLRPYRSEVSLFHAGLQVAGQPDLLMQDEDKTVYVVDWKRIRALTADCRFRTMRPPLCHLPDTNYWHYALQVGV